MKEMSETLRATFNRVLRRENRRGVVRNGTLEVIDGFASRILANERRITVYLPPGYGERQDVRYPVLYAQDGQNLFDPGRAYVPGQSWRLHEAADTAIGERTAAPFIIVGVDHAGVSRIDEYTPVADPGHGRGGRAREYARMLLEELKPEIDGRFRTLTGRDHTAVGGSSLGGLVSLHLALAHPEIFGGAAVMSPSVWWAKRAILGVVPRFSGDRPRLWVDIGGREGAEALRDARALRDALQANGWTGERLRFYEDRRGDHSERAWARRAGMVLEFLFPPA